MNNVQLLNFHDVDPNKVKSITINTLPNNLYQIKYVYNFGSYPILESIITSDQQLKSIDVSQNLNLKYLDCSFNNLTSIDVTNNLELVTLNCQANPLQSIDVTGNPYLENLNVNYNSIQTLNLSENGNLKELYCSSNSFTGSIDLIANNELLRLDVSQNALSSLNLSYTPVLEELYCNANNLFYLDFSPVNTLKVVDCSFNFINTISLSGINPDLTELVCGNNYQLSSLSLGSKPYLTYLDCENASNLTTLDVSGCITLKTLLLNGNNTLGSLDITNTVLERLNAASTVLQSINLNNQFNLKYLDLSYSVLTGSIDLSDCSKLERTALSNNLLTGVILSATNTSTSDSLYYDFSNNNLTTSSITNILQTLDNYGVQDGYLNIEGTNNAGPEGSGVTYYVNLLSKNWTIDTNTPYPTITSFYPDTGNVGSLVGITGSYFTDVTAVKFNDVTASSYTVDSVSRITATVPTGATTGKIRVETSTGFAISATDYNVIQLVPVISSFSPIAGLVGSVITISGDFFLGSIDVRFNGVPAVFNEVSNVKITASVPLGTTTGPITVTNGIGTGTSVTNFTPVLSPAISNFTPSSGLIGTDVEITGSEFDFLSNVKFNNVSSSYTVVSNTGIKATIPAAATTGFITVTTAGGTATTDPNQFTVIIPAPTISNFSPGTGNRY